MARKLRCFISTEDEVSGFTAILEYNTVLPKLTIFIDKYHNACDNYQNAVTSQCRTQRAVKARHKRKSGHLH